MRGANRGDASGIGLSVQQYTPATVDLKVNKSRAENAAVQRHITFFRGFDAHDHTAFNDQRFAVVQFCTVENLCAGENLSHSAFPTQTRQSTSDQCCCSFGHRGLDMTSTPILTDRLCAGTRVFNL